MALAPFVLSRTNPDYAIIEIFAGDNNLADFVTVDLQEALVGLGERGSMLALVDHASRPTEILELTSGRARRIEAPGEIDTGDARTLANFLARALMSYAPQVPIAIGFWDHGSGTFDEFDPNGEVIALGAGARRSATRLTPAGRLFGNAKRHLRGDVAIEGMLHDDSSGGLLTTREAGSVLRKAIKESNRGKVVAIFSDTCLNGMVEVSHEFDAFADCVIASQELEPGDGWDYTGFLQALAPPYDAEAFATAAVTAYGDCYRARLDKHPVTMGGFRTGGEIAKAFKALVREAKAGGDSAFRLLDRARNATVNFDNRDSYDLTLFAEKVATAATGKLADAAKALAEVTRKAHIAHVSIGAQVATAQGISFWFPSDPRSFAKDVDSYSGLAFDKATGWSAYLATHLGGGTANGLALSATRREGPGPRAPMTILYVHGIANKPLPAVLKCQWDRALFGNPLGDRSRMAYWVNRDYYPEPSPGTCAGSDKTAIDDDRASTRAIMSLATGEEGSEAQAIEREIKALADSIKEEDALLAIASKMLEKAENEAREGEVAAAAVGALDVSAKIFPLPAKWRGLLAAKLTRAFLRDVNDFLFKPERRKAMKESVFERLGPDGGTFVVVAHSQGSMIAFDALHDLDPGKYDVPLFVTIGSPLGMEEVKDRFKKWKVPLEVPPCVKRWVNVADRFDPVAIDSDLTGDYSGGLENIRGFGLNPDSPLDPHSGTGYLSTKEVRRPINETLGASFSQVVGSTVLAKDLIDDLENGRREQRRPVLIQLASDTSTTFADLDSAATTITARIEEMVTGSGDALELARIDRLRRYLAADLTRSEVEALRASYRELSIKMVWRNSEKRALIAQSTHTVQARPANLGYGADGHAITWAVLDTGIRADHPHFARTSYGRNVVMEQYDCMGLGPARRLVPGDVEFGSLDDNGHGTHVAGIIAGEFNAMSGNLSTAYRGMAPAARLIGFKVLDADGSGNDSSIIKALDMIAEINDRAGRLLIHGVNLSLGGNFDPSVYGCGHTPLCEEVKRLWRQGVVTILAAGNEGYALIQGDRGVMQANMDLSIGDPANLDEAIAVGSVHKTNPHTYGISYFSSRGPTADGRAKPDLVAPGERILSARFDWQAHPAAIPPLETLYAEMSGTSMAAPHVSGLLAAFLSQRREFIGEPNRIKEILLRSCVDLGRDRYAQGAGLPNLIKMLALQ